ncbi:LamG domain-containing protein [Candidatus Woesearchaeota archaeon]|nr:LamG domain-containing protein [Candidatus Woesearchaeota archaeon]
MMKTRKLILSLILGSIIACIVFAATAPTHSNPWIGAHNRFTDGLVAEWRFELYAEDETSNNNDGTVTGATWTDEGRVGKAYEFDGSNSHIEIAHDSSQLLTNGFTISAWVNPRSVGETAGRVIQKGTGSAAGGYIVFQSNGMVAMLVNGGQIIYSGANSVPFNQWSHISCTVASDGLTTWYINGELSGTPDTQGDLSGITDTNPLYIGDDNTGVRNFDGTIDEVILWNRTLSASEIEDLYNTSSGQYAYIDQDLGVSANNTYDADCDSVKSIINWYVDNVSIAVLNMPFEAIKEPDSEGDHAAGEGGEHTAVDSSEQVGHWRFEGNADDSTSNNNDGNVTGAVLTREGLVGEAYDFDGNDYIDMGDVLDQGYNTSFSVSVWVNNADTSNTDAILGKKDSLTSPANAGFSIYFSTTHSAILISNGSARSYTAGGNYDDVGEWIHHVFICNRELGRLQVYRNGVLESNETGAENNMATILNLSNTKTFQIGAVDAGTAFDGTLDEIIFFNKSLTPSEVRSLYNEQKPHMVGEWQFEGNAEDNSTFGNDGIVTGATLTSDGMVGKAYEFDGVDDYIDCGKDSSLSLTQNFTISYWVKIFGWTGAASDRAGTIKYDTAIDTGTVDFYHRLENDTIIWRHNDLSEGDSNFAITNNLNEWIHIALVYNSTATIVYKNSVEVNVDDVNGSFTLDNYYLYLGADYGSGKGNLTLDEVMIYNRTLSADEIQDIYEDQGGSLRGDWRFEGNADDSSIFGNDGIVYNGAVLTDSGKYGQAYEFDGINDYISVPFDQSFNFTDAVTMSGWFNLQETIVATSDPLHWRRNQIELFRTSTNTLSVYAATDGEPWHQAVTSGVLDVSGWHYYAVVYDGTHAEIYFDGMNVSSTYWKTDGNLADIAGIVGIGKGSSNKYLNGTADEVKVYSKALSASEILELYNKTAKDYSGYGNNGNISGPVWQSSGGYDTWGAYEFDGVDDYIDVADGGSLAVTENITVSAWINPTYSAGHSTIYHRGSNAGWNSGVWFSVQDTKSLHFKLHDVCESFKTPANSFDWGEWTHVVGVYNGTHCSAFINGAYKDADPGTGSINYLGTEVAIGRQAAAGIYYFNGTIDELMIFDRALSPEQIQALYENQTQTIMSEETLGRENWSACLTPNDGTQDGLEYCSADIPIEPTACSIPGDAIAEEVVNFKDATADVDVTVNVYTANAEGNPNPVSGHHTFCYRITSVRNGTVKKFSIFDVVGPENVDHTSVIGGKDPISENIIGGNVSWDFRPTNNLTVGEISAGLYFTSSQPIGKRAAEVLDAPVGGEISAAVPEFTTIGALLSVFIITFGFFYIKRKQKNKKGQLLSSIVFLVIVFVIIIIALIIVKPCPTPGTAYAVKEICDGNVVEKVVPKNTPSMKLGILTDSGESMGTVPLESNKKFRIDDKPFNMSKLDASSVI